MNLSQLFSADNWYEISAAGSYDVSPQVVGLVLGTTQDGANFITIQGKQGAAINCRDYLLKQVPYAIKPTNITITGTVKVLLFERINSQ